MGQEPDPPYGAGTPRNLKRPDASGYGALRIETSERGAQPLRA